VSASSRKKFRKKANECQVSLAVGVNENERRDGLRLRISTVPGISEVCHEDWIAR